MLQRVRFAVVPRWFRESGLIVATVGAYFENGPLPPTLTREEFVSLRDSAKGLMHRIPSEHKAHPPPGRTRAERGSKCVKCAGKVKSDGEAIDLDLQG
jgi:hypothetical protein